MDCTIKSFAEDLPQYSFIDRLQGLSKVKPQSFVDHGLITVTCALGKIPEFIQDVGIDVNGDSLRHAPSKTREPRIIAIQSYPLTTRLNGQSCKPCIRHQVAAYVGLDTKAREDFPMPLARLNDNAVGLIQQYVAEAEHLIQTARFHEDLGVCGDADHPAQYLRSYPVTCIAIDDAIEPGPAFLVVG